MKSTPTITVEQLRDSIKNLPNDAEISFSGLTFYRVKQRGKNSYQIEFNEGPYLSEDGALKVQNP